MPLIALKAMKIDFGKYKGMSFEEAAVQPSYAEWVAGHANPEKSNPTMQMFVEFLNRRTKALLQKMEAAAGYGGTNEDPQMKTGNTKKRGVQDELLEEKIERGDFDHPRWHNCKRRQLIIFLLLGTSASLLVTSALLLGARSY